MVDTVKAQQYLRASVGSHALTAIIFQATAVVVTEGQAVLIKRFGRPLRATTGPATRLPDRHQTVFRIKPITRRSV